MLILPLQLATFVEGCGDRLKLVCKLTNLTVLAPVVDATSLAVGAFVLQRFGPLKSNILSPVITAFGKKLVFARGCKHAVANCFGDVDGPVQRLRRHTLAIRRAAAALGMIVSAAVFSYDQHILVRLQLGILISETDLRCG